MGRKRMRCWRDESLTEEKTEEEKGEEEMVNRSVQSCRVAGLI